ncbi:MAG: hypothetical protein CVU11_00555 [Bacteroidetes bacterium HGW-Bacteroidetes-6]|jgi:hypothetical protein|nr:MAG: hypothetical protein CVU11_00555 [Bacteroidetes bacterium HGW-Bacteroidetes-6]
MLNAGGTLRLIILALFITCNHTAAQDSASVHEKYATYRNRLQYFVVFSNEPGGGLLANIRNRNVWLDPDGVYPSGDEIDYHLSITFGQTHTRTGYLLGTLATEYALLKQAGNTTRAEITKNEIVSVLDAFDRTDLCESKAPWFKDKDTLDGFFIREDAPPVLSKLMYRLFNKDLNEDDYFREHFNRGEYGLPALITPNATEGIASCIDSRNNFHQHLLNTKLINTDTNKTISITHQNFTSQDEILGALVGLSLTIKYVEDSDIQNRALNQAIRMIHFLSGAGKTPWWRPNFPDGTKMGNENGADGRAFAFALKSFAYEIAGKEFLLREYPALIKAPWCRTAFEGTEYACVSGIGNNEYRILRYLTAEALAISGQSVVFKDVGRELKMITSPYDWDTFYMLLYCALHDVEPASINFNYSKLALQLAQAPPNGTWQYRYDNVKTPEGWSAEFKWSATRISQNGETNECWAIGNYSGIDFMLLHNLACLLLKDYNSTFIQILSDKQQ